MSDAKRYVMRIRTCTNTESEQHVKDGGTAVVLLKAGFSGDPVVHGIAVMESFEECAPTLVRRHDA